MRKTILISILLMISLCAFARGAKETYSSPTVRIGALKGPTSMGLVKLLEDNENQKTLNSYEFLMAASADEITPLFLRGELDIIAVPANLGATLYNKTEGKVRLLAVNTLGVLYIVEKGEKTIGGLSDLQGQTIFATGKGTTPEATLVHLLEKSGVTDVSIEFKSEPTEVVMAMKSFDHAVAMLPQPFVTVAMTQLEDLDIVLDLTEEWKALENGNSLITGVFVVREDFLNENPKAVDTFLREAKLSSDYVNEHVDEASDLIEKAGIVKSAVARKALSKCNIVCITGEEMKKLASSYLDVLYSVKPAFVGSKPVGDDFYLVR